MSQIRLAQTGTVNYHAHPALIFRNMPSIKALDGEHVTGTPGYLNADVLWMLFEEESTEPDAIAPAPAIARANPRHAAQLIARRIVAYTDMGDTTPGTTSESLTADWAKFLEQNPAVLAEVQRNAQEQAEIEAHNRADR